MEVKKMKENAKCFIKIKKGIYEEITYKELKEKRNKYKNERCKWFKGLLVFLFLVGSFVSMIISYRLK